MGATSPTNDGPIVTTFLSSREASLYGSNIPSTSIVAPMPKTPDAKPITAPSPADTLGVNLPAMAPTIIPRSGTAATMPNMMRRPRSPAEKPCCDEMRWRITSGLGQV